MAAAAAGLVLLVAAGCGAAAGLGGLYPGLQFDLNQGELSSPHMENMEAPYYAEPMKRWPWKNLESSYDDDNSDLRRFSFLDKLLEYQELAEPAADEDAQAPRPKSRRRHLFEVGGALRPPGSNLGQYRRDMQLAAAVAAHQQQQQPQHERVHDVLEALLQRRQQELNFALQDASKIFGNVEDEDEYIDNIGKDLPVEEVEDNTVGSMGSMGYHEDEQEYQLKEGEQFPNRYKDVPVVEDPTQFAYSPPDPRFYEKSSIGQIEKFTPPTTASSEISSQAEVNPKLNINARSEGDNTDQDIIEDVLINNGKHQDGTKDVVVVKSPQDADTTTVYIIAMVAGISAAATVGLIAIGIGWFNLQRHMKNAEESDYPSYGIVGPNKDYDKRDREETAGDRRLAQSAQMYHYQHQKQQIIAMGRNTQGGHGSVSDTDEEEDEEGNYTVYECPGLASIEGPLEVRNPMFDDDQLGTPSQTPSKPAENNTEETK